MTLLLVLLIAWPVFLYTLVGNHLGRVDALSTFPNTPGVTYLIAGSDARGGEGGAPQDGTTGERTDSLMLIHKAENGKTVVVSLPRDTDVEIADHGHNKLNSAYAFGGPKLLVQTVENLTGLKVDHFVLVKMGGVAQIVDALGGVNLCLDYNVKDPKSELTWKAGCHNANGHTALAFARMRYQDPRGDIGRQERQRQVISKVVKKASSSSVLLNPLTTYELAMAGSKALDVDDSMSPYALAKLAFAYRSAANQGLLGTPPIESLNYRNGHGSSIKLDSQKTPEFFKKLKNGTLEKDDLNVFTGK
ncbi:LCP family protein [Actinomycetaceae bacterium TAE3-ERU4]|nr:LCP family protein [Actinomycetaceae bacterium TAE3-ERU4]